MNLNAILTDQRLARVLNENTEESVKLQFWILQSGSAQNLKLDLIYGWVIPAQNQKQGVWDVQLQASLLSELKKSTEIFRLWRLSLSQSGAVLFRLIEALCQDKSLAEAASAASISAPDAKFSGLHLVNSPLSVEKVFAPRPTVFLTAKIVTDSSFGGGASPLVEIPAWLASLFRLEKLSFWQPIGGERNPNVSELIAEALGVLSHETGFKFLDTDSQRLGNIEWITFPTLNEQRNPLVRFDSVREKTTTVNGDKKITAESASVRIDEGAFVAGTELLVRCRLLNGEEIISDLCESLTFSGQAKTLVFHAVEPISAMLVGVWAKTTKGAQFELVYENGAHLIRSISVDVRLLNSYAIQRSKWLDRLIGKSSAATLPPVSPSWTRDYMDDPWVPSGREIRSLIKKLIPKVSEGAFFIKGQGKESDRITELADWINAILNNYATVTTAVIFDPYFGTTGIDLVAALKRPSVEFIAVTTTTLLSDDSEPRRTRVDGSGLWREIRWIISCLRTSLNRLHGKAPVEPARAIQIKEYCLKIAPSLETIALRILDFRHSGLVPKQLFHDRYLLLFDQDGGMLSGYHFSNSIQRAMVNFPLLITPIPSDLYKPFERYIDDIVKKAGTDRAPAWEIKTLFSSHELRDEKRKQARPSSTTAPAIDSVLLASPVSYSNALCNASAADLPKLLKDLASWACGTAGSDTFLDGVVAAAAQSLGDKLLSWLLTTTQPGNISVATFVKAAANSVDHYQADPEGWLKMTFKEALEFNRTFWTHGFYVTIAPTNEIDLGIQFLAGLNSKVFSDFAVNIYKMQKDPSEVRSYLFGLIVAESFKRLKYRKDVKMQNTLLMCEVPFLRALAAQSAMAPSSTNLLVPLEKLEQVQALANWAYDLRVQANIKGRTESQEIRDFRLEIFAAMIAAWPANITPLLLRQIIFMLSGPIEGSWSHSNQEDLLDILEGKGLLGKNISAELWLTLFLERLERDIRELHFYEPVDVELTRTAAAALVRMDENVRMQWLRRIKKIDGGAAKTLEDFTARSRDYSVWIYAVETVVWLNSFELCVVRAGSIPAEEISYISSYGKHFLPGLLDPKGEEYVSALGDLMEFYKSCLI